MLAHTKWALLIVTRVRVPSSRVRHGSVRTPPVRAMKLHVLTLAGAKELTGVESDDTVDALKRRLHEAALVSEEPSGQRLMHAGKTLNDGELLSDAGVVEGDVIVFMARREKDSETNRWEQRDANKPVPDLSEINRTMLSAKAGVSVAAADGQEGAGSVEESLQGLRIADGEDGAAAESRGRGGIGITLPEPDADALKQIVEMGFPEARARKALLLHRNHPPAAMEWLLEVGDSPGADAELTEEQILQLVNTALPGRAMLMPGQQATPAEPAEPEEAVVQRVMEMGFPREDVLVALRATHNNHDAACAWLLGERSGVVREQMTVAQGNPESMQMLLGDILSHPAIQQGMQSERVLQAFQAMIEDPSSAHAYLNDPEVGPILLRVHSILSRVAGQSAPP